jgi:hypothetical protein
MRSECQNRKPASEFFKNVEKRVKTGRKIFTGTRTGTTNRVQAFRVCALMMQPEQ